MIFPQLILILWSLSCSFLANEKPVINGINLVAPPVPFNSNPMLTVRGLDADWIAVVPYAFTKLGVPQVRHSTSAWWGERPEGVIETIKLAKEAGLKIMLKPQVYVPSSWPGEVSFPDHDSWREWELSYRDYMLRYCRIADSFDVEMVCIGTEFRISALERAFFWKNLIREIRSFFDGKLTYAANWDDYDQIVFWKDLDFIGIDAYFPLDSSRTPEVSRLINSWSPISRKLEKYSKNEQRPIIFTEFGYLSVDYCADKNWELEKAIHTLPINEKAQANALEALFSTFHGKDYWHGGFLWKWFPEMKGHEGYIEKDYTPQGKLAEAIVKKWFAR